MVKMKKDDNKNVKNNKSENDKIVYHKRYSKQEDIIKKTANHIRKIKGNG